MPVVFLRMRGDNCIFICLPAHRPAYMITCLKCTLIYLSEKHNLFKNIAEMCSLEGSKSRGVAFIALAAGAST